MHILTPNREIILPDRRCGIEGLYQFRRFRIDEHGREHVIEQTPLFKNLITNVGLDAISQSFGIPAIQVGAGSATPSVTDTSLQAFIAGTSNSLSDPRGFVNNGSERYYWRRRTMRFAQGAAAGNLSEVGVSSATTGGTLLSRALIRDSSGNPTTITVTAMDFLDVLYECRWHIPLSNQDEGVFDIGGVGTSVESGPIGIGSDGWGSPWSTNLPGFLRGGGITQGAWVSESNVLVPATTSVSGSPATDAGRFSIATYVNGSHELNMSIVLGISVGNFATGIGALRVRLDGGFLWQYGFTPKLPKDNTKQLTMQWKCEWGRHDP